MRVVVVGKYVVKLTVQKLSGGYRVRTGARHLVGVLYLRQGTCRRGTR